MIPKVFIILLLGLTTLIFYGFLTDFSLFIKGELLLFGLLIGLAGGMCFLLVWIQYKELKRLIPEETRHNWKIQHRHYLEIQKAQTPLPLRAIHNIFLVLSLECVCLLVSILMISSEIVIWLLCSFLSLLSVSVPLLIGLRVYYKHQDKKKEVLFIPCRELWREWKSINKIQLISVESCMILCALILVSNGLDMITGIVILFLWLVTVLAVVSVKCIIITPEKTTIRRGWEWQHFPFENTKEIRLEIRDGMRKLSSCCALRLVNENRYISQRLPATREIIEFLKTKFNLEMWEEIGVLRKSAWEMKQSPRICEILLRCRRGDELDKEEQKFIDIVSLLFGDTETVFQFLEKPDSWLLNE